MTLPLESRVFNPPINQLWHLVISFMLILLLHSLFNFPLSFSDTYRSLELTESSKCSVFHMVSCPQIEIIKPTIQFPFRQILELIQVADSIVWVFLLFFVLSLWSGAVSLTEHVN